MQMRHFGAIRVLFSVEVKALNNHCCLVDIVLHGRLLSANIQARSQQRSDS
jgi:hypothetical protein